VIAGVVLAAGSSRRLGHPKQLVELGGKPVLRWVLEAALASSLDRVVVVLGHEAASIRAVLPRDPRVGVAMNPAHEQGQSTSLLAGLASVGDAEAAMVLLGDQPEITAETIDEVIAAWARTGAELVQAAYGGRPGHPVLLARSIWPELRDLSGDEGARGLLEAHPGRRVLVEVGADPPGDLDTPDDLQRLRQRFQP
jgi:molybdenum cofactor cytidylyltransferase